MTEMTVNVVATDPGTRKMISYDQKKYGSHESTSRKLNVNKVDDGYTIIIRDDIFERMDPIQLMENVCDIMTKNVDDDIGLSVNYIFVQDQDSDRVNDKIDLIDVSLMTDEWESLHPRIYYRPINDSRDHLEDSHEIDIDDTSGLPRIKDEWEPDEAVEEIMRQIRGGAGIINDGIPDPDIEPMAGEARIAGDSSDDIRDFIKDYKGGSDYDDFWDDFDDDDDEPEIGPSCVMNRAKHPKRDIRRHGMILVKNKKSMVHDYHILLPIVKEFIPGNSKKIRKFQKEVAKAWVSSYAMTYAEAEKYEKALRKRSEKKDSKMLDAIDVVAGRIFGR